MNDKISIIVPVYNCEKYLNECLNSLVNQTYKNIEVLLINDGSTDNSGYICDEYAKKYNIFNVYHISNKGVSNARNIGLKESQGKYITFIDSDDYVSENYVEILYSYIQNGYDMVIGRTIAFSNNNFQDDFYKGTECDVFESKNEKIHLIQSIFNDNLKNIKYPHISTCSAKLFKKELIEKFQLNYFKDMKFYEDGLFNISYIFNCNKVAVIDKKIYFYRFHSFNSTKKYKESTIDDYEKSYSLIKNSLNELSINYSDFWDIFVIKNLNSILANLCKSDLDFTNKMIILKGIIKKYKISISNVKLSDLPKKRKVFVLLARIHLNILIYYIYKYM